MFDEIMDVKLVSGVFTSDTGKQFSTGMFKKKKYYGWQLLFSRDYSEAILILFYRL